MTLCIHSRHPLWQLAMINVGNCGRLLTGNWHDPLQSIYKGGIAASSGGFWWWIKSSYQIPYVGSSLFNLNPRTIWLIEPYSTQHFLYLLTPRGGGGAKKKLQLSSCKNLQFKTHCLSFFPTFRHSEATLAPFVRAPPYENKAFLTNSVVPWPNGKFFNREKWFLTYLTYI